MKWIGLLMVFGLFSNQSLGQVLTREEIARITSEIGPPAPLPISELDYCNMSINGIKITCSAPNDVPGKMSISGVRNGKRVQWQKTFKGSIRKAVFINSALFVGQAIVGRHINNSVIFMDILTGKTKFDLDANFLDYQSNMLIFKPTGAAESYEEIAPDYYIVDSRNLKLYHPITKLKSRKGCALPYDDMEIPFGSNEITIIGQYLIFNRHDNCGNLNYKFKYK